LPLIFLFAKKEVEESRGLSLPAMHAIAFACDCLQHIRLSRESRLRLAVFSPLAFYW
jgi:hypothetical protein